MRICSSCILLGCCNLFVVSTGGVIIGFTNIMITKLIDGITCSIIIKCYYLFYHYLAFQRGDTAAVIQVLVINLSLVYCLVCLPILLPTPLTSIGPRFYSTSLC